jgi:hypothetical protein
MVCIDPRLRMVKSTALVYKGSVSSVIENEFSMLSTYGPGSAEPLKSVMHCR